MSIDFLAVAYEKEKVFFHDHPVQIQRRAYQRSLNVLVHPSGRVKVTAGKLVPKRAIAAFLRLNESWILKNLDFFSQLRGRYPQKKYVEGESFLLEGENVELKFVQDVRRPKVEVKDQTLVVHHSEKPFEPKELVRKFYEKKAREKLLESVAHWSQEMNLSPRKVSFRSMKSRWGSCSTRGDISLNWRLIVFPQEIYDYVIIHELAHLQHANHSQRFWNLVFRYCSDYKQKKTYLSEHHYEVDFLGRQSELYPD